MVSFISVGKCLARDKDTSTQYRRLHNTFECNRRWHTGIKIRRVFGSVRAVCAYVLVKKEKCVPFNSTRPASLALYVRRWQRRRRSQTFALYLNNFLFHKNKNNFYKAIPIKFSWHLLTLSAQIFEFPR